MLVLTELGRLQRSWLDLIDDACKIGLAARLRFRKETGRFECSESNNAAQLVCHVFENKAADSFDGSLTHEGATELKVRRVETDTCAIGELCGAGSAKSTRQAVLAHLTNKFVVSKNAVRAVWALEEVVCDGRVMARMLTVKS